jgi:hypothetical protein
MVMGYKDSLEVYKIALVDFLHNSVGRNKQACYLSIDILNLAHRDLVHNHYLPVLKKPYIQLYTESHVVLNIYLNNFKHKTMIIIKKIF